MNFSLFEFVVVVVVVAVAVGNGRISSVVPWLETCEDIGVDVNADQITPRLFKTHAWKPHLLDGKGISEECKYILITRNPEE